MAFLLLTTGQIVEVAETRQVVRTALASNPAAITVTVQGGPIDFRSSGIIGIAETREQVNLIPSWWV